MGLFMGRMSLRILPIVFYLIKFKFMEQKKVVSLVVLLLAIIIGSFIVFKYRVPLKLPTEDIVAQWDGSWKTYHDKKYKFSVEYPSFYSFQNSTVPDLEDKPVDMVYFAVLTKSGILEPVEGTAGVSTEDTNKKSGEEWLTTHQKADQFGDWILEKRTKIAGYDAVVYHQNEKGAVNPTITYQYAVFVKDGKLFTISGSASDIERVWASFRFE